MIKEHHMPISFHYNIAHFGDLLRSLSRLTFSVIWRTAFEYNKLYPISVCKPLAFSLGGNKSLNSAHGMAALNIFKKKKRKSICDLQLDAS
jgi:hypothetical protein